MHDCQLEESINQPPPQQPESQQLQLYESTLLRPPYKPKSANNNQNNDEWESTISIPITENQYNKFIGYSSSTANIDVIFLFECGTRMSGRCFQRKTTTTRRDLLSFENDQWYSIQRTTALEPIAAIPELSTITKVIFRRCLYKINNIRVSYNCEQNKDGIRYNVEYEVEYPPNSDYNHILDMERLLMEHVEVNIRRDKMSLEKIFSSVMSKVQMWHVFDPKLDYIWAYKWNGIKSKMLITDTVKTENGVTGNLTYLWPDVNNVSTQLCTITKARRRGRIVNIDPLVNLCLLVEIMDDAYYIIEVVGSLIGETIYTTEPKTNVKVLKHLKHMIGNKSLKLGGKTVKFQRFYPKPIPNCYGDNHDGFIIVQNDMIIKWKIPTVDVKCIGPYQYKVADDVLTCDQMGIVGCIYEICHGNQILRQRLDRIAASTDNEYNVYLQSNKHLLGTTADDLEEADPADVKEANRINNESIALAQDYIKKLAAEAKNLEKIQSIEESKE